MRILIDESLPSYLKHALVEHETFTVQDMGWTGIKNGDLLTNMFANVGQIYKFALHFALEKLHWRRYWLTRTETRFAVFLTADKNLRYQQNLIGRPFAVIVFPSNKLSVVKALLARLREELTSITPGRVIEI